ncbi:MAG: hypothetical protein Q9201_005706 [Fulgogasparrea decipioides]
MPDQAPKVGDHAVTDSSDPSYEDLLGTIQYLVEDRKRLSQLLVFANRTIQEFSQQARHANKLLALDAQEAAAFTGNSNKSTKSASEPSTWIGGSWLAPSEDILAPAEKMWQDGNAQRALIIAGPLLRRPDMTVSEDVNIHLFISAVLRASGDYAQASKYAEDALVIARGEDAYMLASKAEFHRGLCYLKQNKHAQAQWCLVLASHLEGHEEQIETNRIYAAERCGNSEPTDPGRKLELEYI